MLIDNITLLNHDCFRIAAKKVIYTDPYNISKRDKADIILVSHPHHDHCSVEDIARLQTDDTVIVCPKDCISMLKSGGRVVKVGDKIDIAGIGIEAVPAYNIGKEFHTKDKGWVGYIITIDGVRIYFAGDTDNIPEMASFKPIDIALLPIGGRYTMSVEEAADAAVKMEAKTAIPMHYGSVIGTIEDAKRFANILKGKVPVVIK